MAHMERNMFHPVALLVAILILLPMMKCNTWSPPLPPHPLCISQIAVVNDACARLPYTPQPPPSLNDEAGNGRGHGHGHGHRHGHRHRHRHEPSPIEEDCCRWLKALDNECVCDLLVRLPVFLAKPVHEYTVFVDDSCNVTYSCAGRLA